MLIRFIVKNLFSFKDFTEVNMLPGKFRRLEHHIYSKLPIDLLKLNAIYGANGSGKSNLIRSIELLQEFVHSGEMPIEFITETFKFKKGSDKEDVYLGIEYIQEGVPYYYGVTINQGIVIEEELQISSLGKNRDAQLFIRKDKVDSSERSSKVSEITFSKNIYMDEESRFFPDFLKNEILERNQPLLFHMKNRQNDIFLPYKKAAEWFTDGIQTVLPSSSPANMALMFEKNDSFRRFSVDIMRSFGTGVHDIFVETVPIEEFFGQDDKAEAEKVKAQLKAKPNKIIRLHNGFEEILCIDENGRAVAKVIYLTHAEDCGAAKFRLTEESDGTRRLVDFLPVFYNILNYDQVYILDEIERSIHPVLIRELIKKFSYDKKTKGQLIFSTHESNLLDQEIFRPDELWFAEKDKEGATKLYPLSEFKEHHTIDIRRGYLNGRYGAIPFTGNLQDLNWDQYAKTDHI